MDLKYGKMVDSFIKGTLYFGGLASFTYGCWLAWKPLGFLVGGFLLFAISIIADKEK